MPIPQTKVAYILLYSFFLGFFLGIVYELFRLRRRVFKSEKVNKIDFLLVFFEDVFYCLLCSLIVSVFVFYFNQGRYRGVTFIGIGLGFFVYRKTLGRLVVIVFDFIIRVLIRLFKLIVKPILLFGKFIYNNTVGRLTASIFTGIIIRKNYVDAKNGYRIIKDFKFEKIKGRKRNEKAFKYFSKSYSGSVHNILYSNDSADAI